MNARVASIVALSALIIGCNNYTAPGPSSSTISMDQLAGEWRMISALGYIGLLKLNADGTCSYRPTEGSAPTAGTWSLNKSDFSATCGTLSVTGYLIDRADTPAGVLIYGGDADPDNFAVWDYVGQ